MPITFPGNKTMTLYALGAGGYSTVQEVVPAIAFTAAGGWTDGQDITIETDGTYSFGTKPTQKPRYFIDPGREGVLTASPLSEGTAGLDKGTLETDVLAPGSTAVYRADHADSGAHDNSTGGFSISDDVIVMFAKRRTNMDGADAYQGWLDAGSPANQWNYKFWRWWAIGAAASPDHDVVIALGQTTSGAAGNPRFTPEATDGSYYPSDQHANVDVFGLQKDTWIADMLIIKQGTIDNYDATFDWFANGKRFYTTFKSKETADSRFEAYNTFRFPQPQFMYPGVNNWYMWFDCFYLDAAYFVVASSSATWPPAAGDTVEMQVVKAWSDTSISLNLRKGALANMQTAYYYIFKNGVLQNVDSAGLLPS